MEENFPRMLRLCTHGASWSSWFDTALSLIPLWSRLRFPLAGSNWCSAAHTLAFFFFLFIHLHVVRSFLYLLTRSIVCVFRVDSSQPSRICSCTSAGSPEVPWPTYPDPAGFSGRGRRGRFQLEEVNDLFKIYWKFSRFAQDNSISYSLHQYKIPGTGR
jgi:hypothetical protein